MKFSNAVTKELKYYVYIYSDPITEEIFYVGKGKGNRVFSHLDDKKESLKTKYLKELNSKGLKPKLEILIHGLEDEKAALRVESSIIDLLGIDNLTNKQTGYRSATFGRMSLKQIKGLYEKEKVNILEPSIFIRINQAFRYSMSEMELYDYTRGHWVINPERAKNAKYAFSVYKGIVQEVYEILSWYPGGSTYSVREDNELIDRGAFEGIEKRYEFIGNLAAEEIRNKYKFKSVEHYFKKGNSNPIKYCNI